MRSLRLVRYTCFRYKCTNRYWPHVVLRHVVPPDLLRAFGVEHQRLHMFGEVKQSRRAEFHVHTTKALRSIWKLILKYPLVTTPVVCNTPSPHTHPDGLGRKNSRSENATSLGVLAGAVVEPGHL